MVHTKMRLRACSKNLWLLLACLLTMGCSWLGPEPASEAGLRPKPENQTMAPALAQHLAGNWLVKISVWSRDQSTPTISVARSEISPLFGGDFLKEEMEGELFGEAFRGLGILGYSNADREYQSVWIDNFGTGIPYTRGEGSADGSQIVLHGSRIDAEDGSTVVTQTNLQILSPTLHLYELFEGPADGELRKVMELKYRKVPKK